jgi:hypothetical protein
MGRLLKWGLVFALLLTAALSAYIHITDAISDYQNDQIMQETPFVPPLCDHPSCRDQLIRI